MKNLLRNIVFLLGLLSGWLQSPAQAPSGVPYGQPEKLELDLFNIIVFIVLPVLLIAFWAWFRIRKKQGKNNRN